MPVKCSVQEIVDELPVRVTAIIGAREINFIITDTDGAEVKGYCFLPAQFDVSVFRDEVYGSSDSVLREVRRAVRSNTFSTDLVFDAINFDGTWVESLHAVA